MVLFTDHALPPRKGGRRHQGASPFYLYTILCLGGECSRTLRDLGPRFPASEPSIVMPGKMSHHVSIFHKTSNDSCVPFLRYLFVLVLLAPPRSACSTGRSL